MEQYANAARARIAAAKLEQRLVMFINGEIEMTRAQVSAAMGLIDRCLPKMAQQQVIVEDKRKQEPREMSLAELTAEWMKEREQAGETDATLRH